MKLRIPIEGAEQGATREITIRHSTQIEMVHALSRYPICDIGQLTLVQCAALSALWRKGVVRKGQTYSFPTPKNMWTLAVQP